MKFVIDPRFYMSYASFFIYGMKKLGSVSFLELPGITVDELEEYRKGFAVVWMDGRSLTKRLFIDFNDSNKINEKYYDWSDVYAKVNTCQADIGRSKLLPIGPFMGLQVWNPLWTVYMACRNYCRWKTGDFRIPFRRYVLDYVYTFIRRCSYKVYTSPYTEDANYVFAVSTLWYDERTYTTTNKLRGDFVLACRDSYPRFEGGFFYIDSPTVIKEFPKYKEYITRYKDLLTTQRIPMKQYLEKTKKSAVVFSTDAVLGSFGWKLTEYLALGKCIISTPIGNVMPGQFQDGKHYYEVHNEEDIRNAIQVLQTHPDLRKELKENARLYFKEYLSPERVIERIIHKMKEI